MIDDATGELSAQFDTEEHSITMLKVLQDWIKQHGIPQVLYFDRRNAYVPSKTGNRYIPAVCERLGIEIINARSPQAKGRIERVFRVLQDRLRNELIRHGITTITEANRFLQEVYLPQHNARFAIAPQSPMDAHVPVHPGYDLEKVFGRHETRVVRSDWTLTHHTRIFQIPKRTPVAIYPRTKVSCITHLDGKMHVYHNGTEIPITEVSTGQART